MGIIPDDPIIRAIENTGYPPGFKDEQPICPVCGSECSTVYKYLHEIVGCDECLTSFDAWEEDECFPERND